MKMRAQEMRVVPKYYLNIPLQLLFIQKLKIFSKKITQELTPAPSGQILNYIELKAEKSRDLTFREIF